MFKSTLHRLTAPLLLVAALHITSICYAANVDMTCPPNIGARICWMIIKGEIRDGDLRKVLTALSKGPKPAALGVSLDSAGGDFFEAINIGRALRNYRATVAVDRSNSCHSACVMLLAGGVVRAPSGSVGIHRPYPGNIAEKPYEQAQKEYEQLETVTKTFLRDMNLPESLFAAMATVPPHQLKLLTQAELRQYGLNITDPVEENVNNATWARYYDLNIGEYLLRKSLVEEQCTSLLGNGTKYYECEQAIYRRK
jgi:hypothetical protein